MPLYEYNCINCGDFEVIKSMAHAECIETCPKCGLEATRVLTMPNITGTRDGFGIGKNFIDEKTNKEITTWREWEKAGYRKPSIKSEAAKEACERRQSELKGQRLKQPLPQDLPV